VIIVVGIGADGWDGLSRHSQGVIGTAPVVLGGRRQLDLLPDIPGQRRELWPTPLRAGLPRLLATLPTDRPMVALASGDPLMSGIASTLIEILGRDAVGVLPALSSVTLARADLCWPAESHAIVRVVGHDVSPVRRELAPGRRILVLSSDEHTPRQVAELLTETGYGYSPLTILGELGAPSAHSWWFDKAWVVAAKEIDPRHVDFPRLNIVAIECVADPAPSSEQGPALASSWVAGLPDEAFEHDGQLTKRDLRASALARLMPVPGQLLWDVGAGAGSVGIEWMRAHPTCRAVAIEADPERAERIARNAGRLGVPGLDVVTGRAPDALAGLPAPDAIFVGGGATRTGVLDTCLAALRPGGRLVVHGVTLETETMLAQRHRDLGGELTRISVEQVDAIGSFRGWAPLRTVTQWALTR
jgi:precorrin-6Y C5,15-methyltransferase (decarboxylating)